MLNLQRAQFKSIDSGFSDVWYNAAPVGDELNSEQAYTRVGIARRAVDLLANATQSIPLRVLVGDEERPELAPMKWAEVRNLAATYAIVFGAYYFVPEKIGGKLKLRPILPSIVTPRYERGELVAFQWSGDNGQQERYSPRELIWWWEQNLETSQGPGRSMLFSALTDANLINAGGKFSLAWYLRGGPLTLLRADPNTNPAELERLTNWWGRVTRGFRSWFKGVVIRSGLVDPVVFGGDMKAGDTESITKGAEERLVAALGVPASMVFANAANYATAQQDARNLIELSAMPLAQRIYAPFDEKLFNPMGAEIKLEPETMPAFTSAMLDLSAAVVANMQAGLITKQYAQELLHYPVTPRRVSPPVQAHAMPAQSSTEAQKSNETAKGLSLPIIAEISAWEKYELKRLGKPGREFEPRHIAPADVSRIRAALAGANTQEQIKAAFSIGLMTDTERLAVALEGATAALRETP